MNTTHDERRRIGRRLIGQEDELAKVKKIQPGIAELRDGVTLDWLKTNAPWILEAVIEEAIIGKMGSDLIWYGGNWHDGTWRDGDWLGGIWKGKGTWKSGNWRHDFSADETDDTIKW
jgi:hypothetical protein